MRLRRFAASAVLVLFSIVGCTRGVVNNSSIQLSVSSEALAGLSQEVSVMIINVSGPGMTPKVIQQDRHSCGSDNCAIKSEVTVSVPQGKSRLIQVLVVLEDESSGQMVFKYADELRDLSSAPEDVILIPKPAGSATLQAHIYGRYLDSVSSGPSGVLEARFKPPGVSRPTITVMSSYVFSGWFNAFALDGDARFDYYLNNQIVPTLSDLHVDSPVLNGNVQGVLRVDIPTYLRQQYGSGGSVYYQREGAQKFFLGYFGPGVVNQKACFTNTADVSISGAFQGDGSAAPFLWNGAASSPSPTWAWPESGGRPFNSNSSGDVCLNSASDFADHIVFRHKNMNNGHDSLAGFRGPFRAISNGSYDSFLVGTVSGNSVALDWDYLPGVAHAAGVTAARVLMRPRAANSSDGDMYGMGDGVDCPRLQSTLGFTPLGPDVASLVAGAEVSAATVTIPGFTSLENYDIVVCPVVAGGILAPAGIKLEGGGGMTSMAPTFKIVGTTANLSEVNGPGFQAGLRLLKSHATAGYYKLIVQANGRFIANGEVTSVEAQFNGGGTWVTVSKSDYNFGSNGTFLAVALNSGFRALDTGMGDLNADTSVKFRVNLAAGHDVSLPDSFESDAVTFIGATSCPSPGVIKAEVAGALQSNANDLFNSLVTANGSDHAVSFRLRWDGCTTGGNVYAPFDYMVITSSSMMPVGCFSRADVKREANDFLSVIIDPIDGGAQDCLIADLDLKFRTPDTGSPSSMVSVSLASVLIPHSTAVQSYGIAAAVDDLVSPGYISLLYDLILLGANQTFNAQAVNLNSDGRLTSTSSMGVPGDVINWMAGVFTNWFTGNLPSNQDHLTMVTASVPSGGALRALHAAGGTVTGDAALGVMASKTILATSSEGLDGGSPLMLIADGSTIKIAYVPSNSGNFIGQSLTLLNMPTDLNLSIAADFSKIFLVQTSAGRHIFAVLGYGDTRTDYMYGRIEGSGGNVTVNWAPSYSYADEDVAGVAVSEGSVVRPVIAHQLVTNYDVVMGSFPIYNGSAWSGPDAIGSSSLFISNLNSDGFAAVVDVATCGSKLFVVGYDNNQEFKAKPIDAVNQAVGTKINKSTLVNGNSDVTCLPLGADGSAQAFIFTDKTDPMMAAVVAFESTGTPVCGGTAGLPLSTASAYLPTTYNSNGYRGVAALNAGLGSGLYYLYQGAAAETWVAFGSASCGGGSLYLYGVSPLGSLSAPAASLNGLTLVRDNTGKKKLAVYGADSQYYLMRH